MEQKTTNKKRIEEILLSAHAEEGSVSVYSFFLLDAVLCEIK